MWRRDGSFTICSNVFLFEKPPNRSFDDKQKDVNKGIFTLPAEESVFHGLHKVRGHVYLKTVQLFPFRLKCFSAFLRLYLASKLSSPSESFQDCGPFWTLLWSTLIGTQSCYTQTACPSPVMNFWEDLFCQNSRLKAERLSHDVVTGPGRRTGGTENIRSVCYFSVKGDVEAAVCDGCFTSIGTWHRNGFLLIAQCTF